MAKMNDDPAKTRRGRYPTRSTMVGLGLTGLLVAGCTTTITEPGASAPTSISATGEASSGTSEATPTSTSNPNEYCDTSSADRQHPLGVKDVTENGISRKELVYAVRSECVGDPTAPAGVYSSPTQEGPTGVPEDNGTEFTAICYTADGEYIQSNAAADASIPGQTGSHTWVEGNFPGDPKAYIPWANMGFGALTGYGISVPAC